MGVALQFCGTECLRPGLAARSYASFRANLRGVDWAGSTMHLHIDPIGEAGATWRDVADAARATFGRVIVARGTEPQFTRAIRWAWRQPVGPEMFYLQADWLLCRPIEIGEMIAAVRDEGYAAANVLRSAGHRRLEQICLSPLLIRTDVARRLADAMIETVGPEAQLRRPDERPGGRGLADGVRSLHVPRTGTVRMLVDVGRDWMRQHGWHKAGGSAFVRWEVAA